jgi:hypothetical protein
MKRYELILTGINGAGVARFNGITADPRCVSPSPANRVSSVTPDRNLRDGAIGHGAIREAVQLAPRA